MLWRATDQQWLQERDTKDEEKSCKDNICLPVLSSCRNTNACRKYGLMLCVWMSGVVRTIW